MYFCAFKIFVLSISKAAAEEIAALLRSTKPLEDSAHQVEPAGFDEPVKIVTDSAVIIDRNIEKLRGYKRVRDERLVFLTSAGDLPGIDSKTLSKVDDLWVMPGEENDESLLNVYFEKLLHTMKYSSDCRKMEICFRTVIDSLPDLVWFKDNDGAHLIVNDEFCGVVEKTKEQTYKQHHNYIWDVPEDDYENGEAVCRRSEEVVVRERKTCQFEERITTKEGMRQLVTYKSPLIDVDGEIFGTCGMGHDITDLQNISNELRIIIDSIPYGVAIEDADGNVILINKFLTEFAPGVVDCMGHSFVEWCERLEKEKIGEEQGESEYRLFMNGKEYIIRFREEPILDIFGENIGSIQVIRDITIQYNFEQQNIKYANTDFLTGLNNRRSLFDYLQGLAPNSKISMVMVDLDKFKGVNDTYGHAAGDEALEITSRVLVESFPDGFVARLGGDEFLTAIVGEYELEQIEQRTQKLLDTLLENYSVKEAFHALSASAGIAQGRLDVCDIRSIERLMKHCDIAMYNAKESGKARYCVYREP